MKTALCMNCINVTHDSKPGDFANDCFMVRDIADILMELKIEATIVNIGFYCGEQEEKEAMLRKICSGMYSVNGGGEIVICTSAFVSTNLVFIVLNTVLGIMFAIFICDALSKKLKKVYQSAILFPYLMSAVIVGYIVFAFCSQTNGIVNNTILPALGLDPVNWYSEPKYWPFILSFVNTWKGVGYGCLIYISSINGIDPSLYEAASLDGASKWQQIRNITLPSIVPTFVTLTLMNIGRIFYSDFGLFYQVPRNSGMIYSTTNVIDTYVYRGLMEQSNIGMSAAAGFYQSIVGFILVLAANMVVRKFSRENALF